MLKIKIPFKISSIELTNLFLSCGINDFGSTIGPAINCGKKISKII